MKLETELAKASLDRVSRRDPAKLYHMMTMARARGAWRIRSRGAQFLQRPRRAAMDKLNVAVPDFFKAQDELIRASRWRLKTYLDLNLVRAVGACCRQRSIKTFDFYGKSCGHEGNAAALEALRATLRTAIWAKRWARLMSRRRSGRKARRARWRW